MAEKDDCYYSEGGRENDVSYEKQNFVSGQILTAAQLNHMEAGIEAAAEKGAGLTELEKNYMMILFKNAAYKTDSLKFVVDELCKAWGYGTPGVPVQSVTLSPTTLTLSEGESKTLTVTVLPANATSGIVFSIDPGDVVTAGNPVKLAPNVYSYSVTAVKAGTCTVKVASGGKSASCTVTVKVVETAQLIYSLPGETVLTQGLDTGLKLLEHASTETPQYTILVDAKAGDDFNANTWPAFLHCLTETGNTGNLPGFNSTSSPLNKKTEFAYYNYGGVTLSDSIEHFKTRTRYAVQIDGRKYRGGSTYCPLTEWKTTNGTIIDVPQTFLIGAAQSADGSKKQQFWSGTLYQCRVYKGLLSDDKVNDYIEKGW